jgi:hypothetical protein
MPYVFRVFFTKCEERHRALLAQFADADGDDWPTPELRLYAFAGLARLGDRDATLQLNRQTWLSPINEVRRYASLYVLPVMDRAALLKTWEAARPQDASEIDLAVHDYVTERLRDLK